MSKIMTKKAKKDIVGFAAELLPRSRLKILSALDLINGEQKLYLIFRKFNDNYYVANHINILPDNRPPIDSLVCEITESSTQVEKDNILLHELPKKLPDYIIEGFKLRLFKDTTRSLNESYKAFQDRECHLGSQHEDVLTVSNVVLIEAKEWLFKLIDSLTDIKHFFRFAELLQAHGAIIIYLLDLWKMRSNI